MSRFPDWYTIAWANKGNSLRRVSGYYISKFYGYFGLLLNCLRTQQYLIAIAKADKAMVELFIEIINLPPDKAPSCVPNLFSSPSTILKNFPF